MAYKNIQHNHVIYHFEDGALQFVDPPMAHFGFTYWSLMIPPIKPNKVLQLGCGGHTIPHLIEKIWGKIDLTCNEDKDAFQFALDLRKGGKMFDYIIVDVYQGATPHPNILKNDFLHDLHEISSGLIAINAQNFEQGAPYQPYFDIVLMKRLNYNVVTFLKHKDDTRQYFAIFPVESQFMQQ